MDGFARWIGQAIGWLMLPLIFTIMFDVITRKLDYTSNISAELTMELGYSISTILQDLQWHYHGAILLLSFGFGYLANAHVRVDVFRELLNRRSQGWLEFVLLIVLALPFLIVVIVYSWTLFEISWLQNEGSESMIGVGWRWFIKFFMVFGLVVLLSAVLATLVRLGVYLFGDDYDSQAAEEKLQIFADDQAALEAARKLAEDALRRESGRA